jgi:hypothetical protein
VTHVARLESSLNTSPGSVVRPTGNIAVRAWRGSLGRSFHGNSRSRTPVARGEPVTVIAVLSHGSRDDVLVLLHRDRLLVSWNDVSFWEEVP